jgi:hypothetical protein
MEPKTECVTGKVITPTQQTAINQGRSVPGWGRIFYVADVDAFWEHLRGKGLQPESPCVFGKPAEPWYKGTKASSNSGFKDDER